jgi:hypothetical protein
MVIVPVARKLLMRIGLLAGVGALASSVCDPIVTVAPPTALFAETVPVEVALAVVPSEVVVMVHDGVLAPLVDPAAPHPPPVHFSTFPLVSTTSLLDVNAVDGVQGPIEGAVPLVMLKVITQPPAPVPPPQDVAGTPPNNQSVLVVVLKNSVSGEHDTLLVASTGPVTTVPRCGPLEYVIGIWYNVGFPPAFPHTYRFPAGCCPFADV